jgi:transcriptional regulator with XRE-family HTH domain
MNIGYQLMAWRRQKGLTQDALAQRANLTRPYLSRIESGLVDPALSSLRSLASALDVRLGQLLDETPEQKQLSREELDQLARAALRPGTKTTQSSPAARALTQLIKERRRSLGLYRERQTRSIRKPSGQGKHAARWMRAALGEVQWQALLRRIDKLASLHADLP